ncbi:MAG: hypothetical protein J3Q66DRAFT_367061 [Benniella sp.]|nr:MAG: hypothetical protein J3Q66DRAFT_367061 [Benniella sp.]
MRFDITTLALAALVAPALAVQIWDVNIVDGMFEPAKEQITLLSRRLMELAHIPGGFNSGRKTPGQAYQQTLRQAGVVNYKDGIGANCLKDAVGTIFVGPRPDNATETTIAPPAASTRAGSEPNSSVVATVTTAPLIATTTVAHTTVIATVSRILTTMNLIPTPTPSDTPNAASGLSAQGSLFLGLIGALFVL